MSAKQIGSVLYFFTSVEGASNLAPSKGRLSPFSKSWIITIYLVLLNIDTVKHEGLGGLKFSFTQIGGKSK